MRFPCLLTCSKQNLVYETYTTLVIPTVAQTRYHTRRSRHHWTQIFPLYKPNGLRVQLGGEMAKEKSTENGKSTDEVYSSNWIHCDKLAFLVPVIGASKSRDTLKRMNLQKDENKTPQNESAPTKWICNYKNICLFS